MSRMSSHFRLRSSAFERDDDANKILPKRIVFLSVEGDETEKSYFQHLNEYLDSTIIQIEVLRHRHGDGYSDPIYVIELLEEYISVRNGELIPEDLPHEFTNKYSKEIIQKYLNDDLSLTTTDRIQFKADLLQVGIDLEYRKYLQDIRQEADLFAVVLDRDCGSHSRQLMLNCVDKCTQSGYKCYITNPCFEFWLLLHLCDVKSEFSDQDLNDLYSNNKISSHHTKVSYEVSKRACHRKTISSKKFNEFYYPNIPQAIKNAKAFTSTFPDLLDKLGTNVPELLNILGFTDQ